MRSLLPAVLALALIATACSGGDDDDDDGPVAGTFALTIGCTGPACGLSGAMKIPIHEDDCLVAPLLTITLPAVTTSAGDPVTETLNLEQRVYCIEAWLDADTDGTLSTGDAIDSAGGVTGTPVADTPLVFTLDALQP